jgi:hypothetical protein
MLSAIRQLMNPPAPKRRGIGFTANIEREVVAPPHTAAAEAALGQFGPQRKPQAILPHLRDSTKCDGDDNDDDGNLALPESTAVRRTRQVSYRDLDTGEFNGLEV